MKNGVIFSIAFHVALVALSWFGLPILNPPKPLEETPVFVELVEIDEIRNAPPPAPVPEPEPEKKPEPEPEAAKAPPPAPKPEPTPPAPAPEPQIAALPPKPEPEPEPVPEPKKKPAPEPEPKPEAKPAPEPEAKPEPKPVKKPEPAAPQAAKAALPKKPKPPQQFEVSSLLKTLEEIKKTQKPEPEKPEKKKDAAKPDFAASIRDALKNKAQAQESDPSKKVTMTELDAMRRQVISQVAPCWNVNPGAKNAENLAVVIRMAMNPDGTVQSAVIDDQARYFREPYFQSAADAAKRAVLNPRCNPIKLPPDRYDIWRTITINFDPKELL